MAVQDPEFYMRMHPKLKAVHRAVEEMLQEDPATYSTEELVQVWATLDYGHAMMRTVVYLRPDLYETIVESVCFVQDRLVRPGAGT